MKSIDLAAEDERIKLLVLNFDELGGLSPSRAIAIGERLAASGTGKQVSPIPIQWTIPVPPAATQMRSICTYGQVLLTGLGGDRLFSRICLGSSRLPCTFFGSASISLL